MSSPISAAGVYGPAALRHSGDRGDRLADRRAGRVDLLAGGDQRRRDRHRVAERAHQHAALLGRGERAQRQVRALGERLRIERDGAQRADARADLPDERPAGERGERRRDLVLELAPALQQALALDDVEVRHRGGAAGRMAGVGLAVAEPDAGALGGRRPERLGDARR